jgi:hydroxypyruvate isomerase
MPRFAANLSMLFTEVPLLDRFAAAKQAGFDAVEVLFPYAEAPGEILRRADLLGLTMVLINTPPPDWDQGDRGLAAVPGRQAEFRAEFRRALAYAERLRPRHVHVMAGNARGPEAHETYLANLAWAAAQAPEQSLTIEPISPIDMPGYFLNDFDLAAEIIAQIDAPNLGLQFDAYHAHRITGDVGLAWQMHGPRARHVQIAGYPGRNEPAGGAIDYPAFFRTLDETGYAGWVSAEYRPAGRTAEGLGWISG